MQSRTEHTPTMSDAIDYYVEQPWTTSDRRLGNSASAWIRSFSCSDMAVLIVCRGPIRKEAMDVFAQIGSAKYGILLSEKDSIVYTQALAPELRSIASSRVHRIKDYSGASKEERIDRVQQIIDIAKRHGYGYVFAGYGFMAEDADFVEALENAGLSFIGPCSRTQRAAGSKDEAKRTALAQNVSVTPGVNDVTTRALVRKAKDVAGLARISRERGLDLAPALFEDENASLESLAEAVLATALRNRVDVLTIEEIAAQVTEEVADMLARYPGYRVRLKAIAGGGGKGQRILSGIEAGDPKTARARAAAAAKAAPDKLREVLSEVKATGVGDNKNVLVELNVEQTRHNEIQLLGNGEWCVSLGGRDCSLQIHEQKLLEVSLTQQSLAAEVIRARSSGRTLEAEALEMDLSTLQRMEQEAERFGLAVGLDSASTFECIVDLDRHYFMEVNTRIQVEHRVSELCYALRFTNHENATDYFDVTSLVEAMALLARHGRRLPRPSLVLREGAAVEARLNATDRALQPHSGGIIVSWTDPIEGEIRDDQGICLKNPDTGQFMHYRVSGAYDSNIALLVTAAADRRSAYSRLCEILRRTKLRGHDLATNLEFHYGLLHWFLAHNVHAKPTTRFVVPYLTLVGLLKEQANLVDLSFLFAEVATHHTKRSQAGPEGQKALAATREILTRKETLLRRPLEIMFQEPQFLSAWLSAQKDSFIIENRRVVWQRNPLSVLFETYHLLNMELRPGVPAAHLIWDHDRELLERGLRFYERLEQRISARVPLLRWPELARRLMQAEPASDFDEVTWQRVRSVHTGQQMGLEMLAIVPLIGERAGFYELRVEQDLSITIPERLLDSELSARMRRVLVPPPATKADEVVAVSGGMFYAQEAPDRPPFVEVGSHFAAGQPLYVIEVMKMFNKVLAPFSGRIDAILVSSEGAVVHKGQPLFKVTPDEKIVDEDPVEVASRRRESTKGYIAGIAM